MIDFIRFYLALPDSTFAVRRHYFKSDCPFWILLEKIKFT